MPDNYVAVFITVGSAAEAEKLSRGLVEEKLAYCVNAIPAVKSTYFWEGKICVDEEMMLVVKSLDSRFENLERWVRKHHSYDVPEVIALPLVKGSPPYLKCIDDWLG
ncbi:MAG: divalent-cation tolerance protein CutA [Nitrospinota bacterium]|nr:divalent-cation tolerance protein CutA [Nitrospinota bacterium]